MSTGDGFIGRIRSVARLTLGSLLVRGGIFIATLIAFGLAYPGPVLASRVFGLLVIVAALPAIGPQRGWPTFAVLLAVGGWLVSTIGYDEPITLWRLLGLTGSLYLAHSLCALAAALPLHAVVAPEVVARWVSRALGVVLASAVLAIMLLTIAGRRGETLLVAVLGGLAAAVGAAALLAHRWER